MAKYRFAGNLVDQQMTANVAINLDPYTARGATPDTAALAYVLGLAAGTIDNGGGANARGSINHGGNNYDATNAGRLKALVDVRSEEVSPLSADGNTARGTNLTAGETPVFAQGVLNNQPKAAHATAVLLEHLRT